MLQISIVLSIVLGFLSSEFLGLLTGGLVSAGYIAFYMSSPYRIVCTLALSVIVTLIVKLLQRWIIIYGRRRFMITVLLSILLGQIMERCMFWASSMSIDIRIIGYMIPGLIANDMEKQGIVKTLVMIMICALIIWLALKLYVIL